MDARTWGDVLLIRQAEREAGEPGYKPGRFARKTASMFDEAAR